MSTPILGVDVKKTFDVSTVELVVAYEPRSKSLATYSPTDSQGQKEILLLNYLEPHVTFFVLAKSDTTLDIKSTELNESCRKIIQNNNYEYMTSSALNKEASSSEDKTISFKTRYLTLYERGQYNDTRVMLIYPKVDSNKKASYKYGPASPKISISYAKEYEEKEFYTFDYKNKKCYKGIFPSMRIPPYPILEDIK